MINLKITPANNSEEAKELSEFLINFIKENPREIERLFNTEIEFKIKDNEIENIDIAFTEESKKDVKDYFYSIVKYHDEVDKKLFDIE